MADGTAKSGGGHRIALAIGNATYDHARALNNAKSDAQAIADKLRAIGFGQVTLAGDLGFEAMRRELQQFGRAAASADMAILYYAGHALEIDGENYLIPTDAKLEHERDASFEAIPLMQAMRAIEGPGALRLMILDACRDNPFTRMERASGRTRTFGRGLAEVEPAGNALVAFAAKGGTVALDGDGPHSPFAQALIDLIPTPGLEVGFLFRQVRDAVLKTTGRKQEPYLYGSLGSDPIYLVPEDVAPVAAPQDAPLDVFISYASADRDCAEVLARDLEAEGYHVWWDSKLLGGQQFRKAILSQLEAARAAVVIWSRSSVESDWVYDEASRARSANKLITIRVADLDPKEIQPPFGALHAILLDDRAGLRAALAARGVMAKPAAPEKPSAPRGPVDDRTLEHDYWIAIQASDDPSDFEMFLEKFPHGIYAPVARKRTESLIASGAVAARLQRFLSEHPDSERAPLARARVVELEWSKLAASDDAPGLRTFIARERQGADVERAKAKLATLEWRRVAASDDPAIIEQVMPDLRGFPEGALAAARVDGLRREAAAWSAALAANDIAPFESYLRDFPGGAHAGEAREKLKALRASEPILNPHIKMPELKVPRFALNPAPYLLLIAGAAILAILAVTANTKFYGLNIYEGTYLASGFRTIYVGGMVALAWRLSPKAGLVRTLALFAGMYVFETLYDLIPSGDPTYALFLNTLQMPLEWTIVAAVMLDLKDRLMFVIATLFGLATGLIVMFLDQTWPSDNTYLLNLASFPLTGLCIACGFLRRRPDLKGTNWLWRR